MEITENLTAEEMLQTTVEAYNRSVNDMSKFAFNERELKMFTEMMDEYAEEKMKQGCKMQIEACSDSLYSLLLTDDDPETWHEKIKKTEVVKYCDL